MRWHAAAVIRFCSRPRQPQAAARVRRLVITDPPIVLARRDPTAANGRPPRPARTGSVSAVLDFVCGITLDTRRESQIGSVCSIGKYSLLVGVPRTGRTGDSPEAAPRLRTLTGRTPH